MSMVRKEPTEDEKAEAMARAMYAVEHKQLSDSKWDAEPPDVRDYWIMHAGAALTAYYNVTA